MDESVRFRRSQNSVESSSENYTTDDVLSGCEDESNDPRSSGTKNESNSTSDFGTESNQSSESTSWTGLSTIVHALSDLLLKTELAEMEMIKARDAARWETEKRRLEMEIELTRMVLQTYLQAMTSLVEGEHKISPGRKRKRSAVEEHESLASSSTIGEKSLSLLGLIQLNMIFSNSLT